MNNIWTTGITVKNNENGWVASCKWCSGEFAKNGFMEGEVATRYYEPTITQAVDYVLDYMRRMNIERSDEVENLKDTLGFALYYDESEEENLSENSKIAIKEESIKRGWKCYI